jgi:hypothetical protein
MHPNNRMLIFIGDKQHTPKKSNNFSQSLQKHFKIFIQR